MHLKNNLNTKLSRSVANVDINPCPECGAQATYQQNERDGGFYLGCACGLKTGCVDSFTQNDIELIRTQWNTMTIETPFSQAMRRKYNLREGAWLIVRTVDSYILAVFESSRLDHTVSALKKLWQRDPDVKYDLYQLVEGELEHIANNQILATVAKW